jgi:hypothetical protein
MSTLSARPKQPLAPVLVGVVPIFAPLLLALWLDRSVFPPPGTILSGPLDGLFDLALPPALLGAWIVLQGRIIQWTQGPQVLDLALARRVAEGRWGLPVRVACALWLLWIPYALRRF